MLGAWPGLQHTTPSTQLKCMARVAQAAPGSFQEICAAWLPCFGLARLKHPRLLLCA